MQTSASISGLAGALASAQGEIEAAAKDKVNPAFRSKYADLTSVWDACRPVLAKHSLSVVQEVTGSADGVNVNTRIIHKSGEWIEFGPLFVPTTKKDAQGVGSAITYAKRYSLSAALGVVADDDDDGNAASQRPTSGSAPAKPAALPEAPNNVKNPPGISAVKQEVRDAVRELNACSDDEQLRAYLQTIKPLIIKVAQIFTSEWRGEEDGSGLRGMIEKAGVNVGVDVSSLGKWLDGYELKQAAE